MSNITIQEERWEPFVKDGWPLFLIHYDELSLDKKFKLALDPTPYLEAERKGTLFLVTMRDNGILIGYFVGAIVNHLHYAQAGPMVSTDMYFILSEYRNGNTGLKFFADIEARARTKGAVKFYITCKAKLDISPMLEAMGFHFTDRVFTKLLE